MFQLYLLCFLLIYKRVLKGFLRSFYLLLLFCFICLRAFSWFPNVFYFVVYVVFKFLPNVLNSFYCFSLSLFMGLLRVMYIPSQYQINNTCKTINTETNKNETFGKHLRFLQHKREERSKSVGFCSISGRSDQNPNALVA